MSLALTTRLITAVALVVAVCEVAAILHYLGKPPARAGAPVPVATPRMPERASLDVQRKGRALRMRWGGKAAEVRDATVVAKEEPPAHPAEVRDLVVPLPSPEPAPDVTEATEPPKGSRWGRMVDKIPLLRRLKKHPESAPAQGDGGR